ncbi:hypothetical protein, partial [Bradyrhizobium sp. BRP22]|uniref:hypothetical protein n=1 Tax=Bradyrhizobium sp. BRP22 TaxID=2793821 RepID=UPI001CD4D979
MLLIIPIRNSGEELGNKDFGYLCHGHDIAMWVPEGGFTTSPKCLPNLLALIHCALILRDGSGQRFPGAACFQNEDGGWGGT